MVFHNKIATLLKETPPLLQKLVIESFMKSKQGHVVNHPLFKAESIKTFLPART
jgi:hypothetical protein